MRRLKIRRRIEYEKDDYEKDEDKEKDEYEKDENKKKDED